MVTRNPEPPPDELYIEEDAETALKETAPILKASEELLEKKM